MDYLEMISRRSAEMPERAAFILDQETLTYGQLAEAIEKERGCLEKTKGTNKRVAVIREKSLKRQLIHFLALSGTGTVPVLAPLDIKTDQVESVNRTAPPKGVCMGFMTSGTTGEPKVWFRSFESWYDFFPIQNSCFGFGPDTRLFGAGSLAFTGNLNMYLGILYAGGTIIASETSWPPSWAEMIGVHKVNAIYLIPVKLRALSRYLREKGGAKNERVQCVVSGSQSMGKEDAQMLKRYFPSGRILLYYGASELSYVSYLDDTQMGEEPTAVGRLFPGVRADIRDGEIYVDTPYGAHGVRMPHSVGDLGYFDETGMLHLTGRTGNLIRINGRHVCVPKVEDAILQTGLAEENVVLEENGILTAYIVPETDRKALYTRLKGRLADYEIPKKFVFVKELKKNESGKYSRTFRQAKNKL